jgi:hypothetical protein
MATIASDSDYKTLKFFYETRKKTNYKWSGTYGTSDILNNQCWSAGRFFRELNLAARDYIFSLKISKVKKKVLSDVVYSLLSLLYSHWHNFLLPQMRESLFELHTLLLYKEGKITRKEAEYRFQVADYNSTYVKNLLDKGSDFYKEDYLSRDKSKINARISEEDYITKMSKNEQN